MKLRYILLFCLCCMLGRPVYAQKPFEHLLGDLNSTRLIFNIHPTKDNGYIIFGESITATGTVTEVVRTDACNHVKWTRRQAIAGAVVSSYRNDRSVYTADNGFAFISMMINALGSGIAKLDSNGSLLWQKLYFDVNGNVIGSILSIAKTSDDGFILLQSPSNGVFTLIKTDGTGSVQWTKSYSNSCLSGAGAFNVFALKDKGYLVLTAEAGPFSACSKNHIGLAIRTDASGKLLWARHLIDVDMPNDISSFNTCLEDNSGNIYLAGGNTVVQMNPRGNISAQRFTATGYNLQFTSMTQTQDGHIALGGNTTAAGSSKYESFIMRMDYAGALDWAWRYPASSSTQLIQVENTSDDGLIAGINSSSLFTNNYNVIKTDKQGKTTCTASALDVTGTNTTFSYENQALDTASSVITDNYMRATVSSAKLKITNLCSKKIPDADLGPDTAFCFGNTYTIDLGPKNPGCRFRWSTGDTTAAVTFSKTGTYWVQVTKDFCTDMDTINLKFYPRTLVHLGPDTTICPHESVLLTAYGDTSMNFQWFLPNGATQKGRQLIARDAGYYRVRVADAGGCVDLDTIHIMYHPMPKGQPGPDTLLCYNQEYTIHASGGITYKWIPATYLSSDSIADPVAKLPNTQRYLLIVTNAQGCRDTTPLLLKVRPPLQVKLTASATSVCYGQSVNLAASGKGGDATHYKYYWPDDVLASGQTQPLKTSGWHRVQLQDGCSPAGKDSVYIRVNHTPALQLVASPLSGCTPLEVQLSANADSVAVADYTWYFGDGDSINTAVNSTSHIYKQEGIYKVKLSLHTSTGCAGQYALDSTIHVYTSPVAAFTPSPFKASISRPDISFRNESQHATRYYWTFDNNAHSRAISPAFTYTDTGKYKVMLVAYNAFGCADTAVQYVTIYDLFRLFIPNAFSPNDDGLNDVFDIKGTSIVDYDFAIYNRWGEAVFHSGPDSKAWNGAVNNQGPVAEEGVYLYQLMVTDIEMRKHYLSGTFHLVR